MSYKSYTTFDQDVQIESLRQVLHPDLFDKLESTLESIVEGFVDRLRDQGNKIAQLESTASDLHEELAEANRKLKEQQNG